ncbi:hypothetical protein NUW54_g13361 [Trametes sanguinea]|uniref:Uncharacterized protein n=1 Tax=Trametes sanguinea TaxID=158606 RepID=A0ACC1MMA3_9APHY|nr:hypothetical protein NUW54_g13361 [Trametes sanguinea]
MTKYTRSTETAHTTRTRQQITCPPAKATPGPGVRPGPEKNPVRSDPPSPARPRPRPCRAACPADSDGPLSGRVPPLDADRPTAPC